MPHYIQYEIARDVQPGYTLGAQHIFSPRLRDKDLTRKSHRKRVSSLGGVPFTTYYYGANSWDLDTVPLGGTDANLMHMFLQSVEDGQVFIFDPYYAHGGSPSSPRAVILDSESYTPSRKVRRGAGGGSDLWVFTFKLLEVT